MRGGAVRRDTGLADAIEHRLHLVHQLGHGFQSERGGPAFDGMGPAEHRVDRIGIDVESPDVPIHRIQAGEGFVEEQAVGLHHGHAAAHAETG